MCNIAVVGSRTGFELDDVGDALDNYVTSFDSIITGGAPRVDSFALAYVAMNNIQFEVIRPIDPSKKLDYLFRNVEIITKADKIIAFWDGSSRGTKFVIDYANARNKEVIVIKNE